VRQVVTQKEILGALIPDQYKAEQMQTDHVHFQKVTQESKAILDKIRLQINECTNTYAYRIYCVIDAPDIDFPDKEIEVIL
jgi:hypothetical protein